MRLNAESVAELSSRFDSGLKIALVSAVLHKLDGVCSGTGFVERLNIHLTREPRARPVDIPSGSHSRSREAVFSYLSGGQHIL